MNRRFAFVVLGLGVAGCTTEPEVIDISGPWSFTDSLTSTFFGDVRTCETWGTLGLRQTSAGVRGGLERNGLCTDSDGAFAGNASNRLDVDGGAVTGHSIWFTTGSNELPALCHYTATITGDPPHRMDGSATIARQHPS